jgi:hypothetical protein
MKGYASESGRIANELMVKNIFSNGRRQIAVQVPAALGADYWRC